ncbi:hypothetical protein TNCV_3901901 [Trichonephila clavipes]|nr:hypothetical protein TNCV_3901901 [Trichonephila clavipes]
MLDIPVFSRPDVGLSCPSKGVPPHALRIVDCENLLCEKLFLRETAPSLDSFSEAGQGVCRPQPNSSKVSSQPARRCVRGDREDRIASFQPKVKMKKTSRS